MTRLLPLASLLLAVSARAAEGGPLPFLEDDYPKALAAAKAQHLPLFVDTWTTWCHSCRFMRAGTLADPTMAKEAKRFVWLSLDAEKPSSVGFLSKFPVTGYPTLWVIDPAAETAVLKWEGTADVDQLEKLLGEGERAVFTASGDTAQRALAAADRLEAAGQTAQAIAAYRKLLDSQPPDWDRRGRTAESLLQALGSAQPAECVQESLRLAPTLPKGVSYADVVASGLDCAQAADDHAHAATFEQLLREAIAIPSLSVDDRSSLYGELVDARQAAKDDAGAKRVAKEWWDYLDGEAAKAKTIDALSALDPHRTQAARAMGDPARAIPLLQASEKALPDDYNAPARLAAVFGDLGRYDDGLAAIDRALAKSYGPRTLVLLMTKATLQQKKGEVAAARRTLEDALTTAARLPKVQQSAGAVARVKSSLAALPAK